MSDKPISRRIAAEIQNEKALITNNIYKQLNFLKKWQN